MIGTVYTALMHAIQKKKDYLYLMTGTSFISLGRMQNVNIIVIA